MCVRIYLMSEVTVADFTLATNIASDVNYSSHVNRIYNKPVYLNKRANGPWIAHLNPCNFWPQVIIWTDLVEVHNLMLHTKYQDSRSCGFGQKVMFSFYKPMLNMCTPKSGQIWTQGHNLNKLDRGLLNDATLPISRLWALWFQTRRFFHVVLFSLIYMQTMWPLVQAILATGPQFE